MRTHSGRTRNHRSEQDFSIIPFSIFKQLHLGTSENKVTKGAAMVTVIDCSGLKGNWSACEWRSRQLLLDEELEFHLVLQRKLWDNNKFMFTLTKILCSCWLHGQSHFGLGDSWHVIPNPPVIGRYERENARISDITEKDHSMSVDSWLKTA